MFWRVGGDLYDMYQSAGVTPTVPLPEVQSFWQYIVLSVLSGGGVLALQQFISAYKTWKAARSENKERETHLQTSLSEHLITSLQDQVESQTEHYQEQLRDKDLYYQEELERRQRLHEQSIGLLQRNIEQLQVANEVYRDRLNYYESRFGPPKV